MTRGLGKTSELGKAKGSPWIKEMSGARPLGKFLTPLVNTLASRHDGHRSPHDLVAQQEGNCGHSTKASQTAAKVTKATSIITKNRIEAITFTWDTCTRGLDKLMCSRDRKSVV